MRYGTFLQERLGWAVVFGWLLFSIETFLLTVKGSVWLEVYVAVNLIGAYFFITYLEFRGQKKYWDSIQEVMEGLEKRYLLPEMMPVGKREEERLFFEVACAMGKSMSEQVAEFKRKSKEYKEYIELWIHEVKIPIATAKMILTNYPHERAGDLTEEIEQIEGYTEQALFYARSGSVEKDYLVREIKLLDVVNEAVLQNKKSLINKKAIIELDNLELTVFSDSKWLIFMLGQIIGNSIKYASEDGLKLKIFGQEHKESISLHVADNGIGIASEEVERVWEKGFTGSNGRKNKKSTGIGLYLCRKLCMRLGHGISLTSKESKGCEVTFIFPKSDFNLC